MRLLITTQAVDADDPALGFFHTWLARFAERYESVDVLCLKEGRHALPPNVRVHSLGKERGARSRLSYALRFYRLLWALRGRYDAVFVHMNPEYVVLGGVFWRLTGKRIVLWYTHRNVDLKLRLAVLLASAVATAAPESLRVASSKAHVVGHGIDTAAFAAPRDGSSHAPPTLISVGRITPIKRLEVLIDAVASLKERGIRVLLTLVGDTAVPSDGAYKEKLIRQIHDLGLEDGPVAFFGTAPYATMPRLYRDHDISVNLAPTGGIDKAVLESMAAGCIPLVANRAFEPLFGEDASLLIFDGTPGSLAGELAALIALPARERAALAARLEERARREADLSVLIGKLDALLAA